LIPLLEFEGCQPNEPLAHLVGNEIGIGCCCLCCCSVCGVIEAVVEVVVVVAAIAVTFFRLSFSGDIRSCDILSLLILISK
jgi:hypothetical protein